MAYTMIVISLWNEVIDRTWNEIPKSALTAIRFGGFPMSNIVSGENQHGGATLH